MPSLIFAFSHPCLLSSIDPSLIYTCRFNYQFTTATASTSGGPRTAGRRQKWATKSNFDMGFWLNSTMESLFLSTMGLFFFEAVDGALDEGFMSNILKIYADGRTQSADICKFFQSVDGRPQ